MRCEVLTGKPPSITFTFENEGQFTASMNGKYSHSFKIVNSVDDENINANPPQIKSILLLLLFNSNWWVYSIFKAVYWNSRVFILFIIIFSDIKIEGNDKQDNDIILNTPFTLSFYYVFIFIFINSIVIMNYVLLLR